MKLLLKKITLGHMTKNKCGYQMHIFVTSSQSSTPLCGGAFAWCSHFVSHFAPNAPTESCRCTNKIPWYHQNPAYTHRILFALTAWYKHIALYKNYTSEKHNTTSYCKKSKLKHQGPLLLTWINFNPSMDISYYIHYNVEDEITYPFINFNDANVEV